MENETKNVTVDGDKLIVTKTKTTTTEDVYDIFSLQKKLIDIQEMKANTIIQLDKEISDIQELLSNIS